MNGIEGLGEAVTGGMAARALEPSAGEPHGHGSACLNCGTRLTGEFCHHCGQQAHVHRSLHAFWHDLAHSVLHFEGKIWRTLPLLAIRPGVLTRRYIAGERARFLSPMALFLFSVFLMFAVFSWTGGPISLDRTGTGRNMQTGMQEAKRLNEAKIAELERRRAEAASAKLPTDGLDQELKTVRDEAALVSAMADKGVLTGGAERISDDLPQAPRWFNDAYKKAKANPALLIYKLQNSAYKFSWALIPISVPFMWLLFPFSRRFHIYDHTVFVTYSLCFMTLLLIVLSLLGAIGLATGTIVLAMLLIPPVHMYKQLRGAYRLSRWSSAWRMVLLLQFASWAALLFMALLLSLGLLG